MALKEIVPGVFVVSVPVPDALAFKRFFAVFGEAFLQDDMDFSECPFCPSPPRMSGRRRSPFPEPPTPPPVLPPWMGHGAGSSAIADGIDLAIKAQHQQSVARQADGGQEMRWPYTRSLPLRAAHDRPATPPAFPLAYPDPPRGRSIHRDLSIGPGSHPPPSSPVPPYPNPPRGRAVGEGEEDSKSRRTSVSSYDSMLASRLVPGPEPARPHTPDVSPNAPKRAAAYRHYFAYDMSTTHSAKAEDKGQAAFCACCSHDTGR